MKPARRPRRRRPLLAAVLGISALLALGLIVIPDDGDDGKASNESDQSQLDGDSPKGKSQALIGNPHTADLCALADPAALDRYGEAEVDVDYGNFDRCDVLVRPDDKTRIDVSIQLRPGSPPETSEPVRTIGKIGIVEEQPEDDECGLLLTPDADSDADADADADADGMVVAIRVNEGDGSVVGGSAALCTVADSAARSAAEVLNRGPIPRRSPAYPEASLAWANACKLLDTKALSVVPGLKADEPEVGVANWSCEWSSNIDELETEVGFFRDQPKSAADGTPIKLSGYDALVEPEGNGDETCTVFVEYREYGGQDAETAAEMLRLHVGGQRPTDELCEMATDLTASAASELRAQ